MIPDRCSFCKGTLHEGKTECMVKVDNEIIVIQDIPAYVCDRCQEPYFTPDISRKIDVFRSDLDEASLDSHNKLGCVPFEMS